jgi:hypothetical protein
MVENVGFLYVNGLGHGATTPKDRVVNWWWNKAGLQIRYAHVNWYDQGSLKEKIDGVEDAAKELLKQFGGAAIIGESAGGSLALNAFHRLKNQNVVAVNAHGRVKVGDYSKSHRMSLYHRAKLNTSHPSQSFYNSVVQAETQTIPALSKDDKDRLLVLTQLTDLVVPLSFMQIEGVESHRSLAFGHLGGFVAHMIADRDIITSFAKNKLQAS